jgi:hypothetical protein
MSAKEKAEDLIKIMLYCYQGHIDKYIAKEYALIAVDQILESEPRWPSNVDWDDCGATHQYYYEAQTEEADNYWQEVKKEIEKL